MDCFWVNHEYSSDVFVQGAPGADGKYTAKQIEQMLYVQGGSIIGVVQAIKKADGRWILLLNMHAVLLV